jgi:hypothetical protein
VARREAPVGDASYRRPDGSLAKAGNFVVVYVDKDRYRDIVDIVDNMTEIWHSSQVTGLPAK